MAQAQNKTTLDPDLQAGADRIAERLGETMRKPRSQIEQIVVMCGLDYAESLLAETLDIEANGGMLTNDGKRRRTPGGVYFQLARQQLPQEIREEIFHQWRVKMRLYNERETQFPPFTFDDRMPTLEAVLAEQGEISDVKVTLVGRPGAIERRQDVVITSMTYEPNNEHSLPKGVPQLILEPITYVVYISARHWEKVEKALFSDDKDKLMIDGIQVRDPEADAWSVLATYVTTRKLEKNRQQREKQQASSKAQASKPPKGGSQAPARIRAG
ncbi:hypothetical protein HC928_22235 [bacterium]|nr:hypothetical protein [bacterium]